MVKVVESKKDYGYLRVMLPSRESEMEFWHEKREGIQKHIDEKELFGEEEVSAYKRLANAVDEYWRARYQVDGIKRVLESGNEPA